MQKSNATIRLSKIAWILIAVCLGLQILMTVLSAPLGMLVYRDEPLQLSAGVLTMAMILYLTEAPLLVYAIWQSRQTTVTHQSAVRSAILLPVCYFGQSLLCYPITFIGYRMLDNSSMFQYSRLMNLVQPVFYLYLAAFILLACAEAIEYQMTVPKKDAIKPLTLFAVVGSSFYLAVRCIGILCVEPIASLMHRNLMLPMKWKFALLLFAAVELVPFAILAMISHFSHTSAMTKLIAAPALYYGIMWICTAFRTFFIQRFVNVEGMETVAAYVHTESLGEIANVCMFVAVVCLICAGAMEFHQKKIAPSDGEPS